MKYLLLMLIAPIGLLAQDSIWVPGTIQVKIAKPKPEVVVIRDTVSLRDTVYLCPTVPTKRLKWSEWNGTAQAFFDAAETAVIDKPMVLTSSVSLRRNIRIVGTGKDTISSRTATMFLLDSGFHQFDSLVIVPQETAMLTTGLAINDSISNTRIVGGKFAYQSSLGGGVTAFRNCYLANSDINIQIYSQTANGVKSLHLYNVELRTDVTHNVYAHPNVNIHFEGVNASKSGRLALNYFSSGHDEYYGKARYFRLIRCTGSPMSTYTVIGPEGGAAIVDSCNIAPYGTWHRVAVTNSHLYNGGQGVIINGIVANCTGEVWSGGGETVVTNSRLSFATARAGGTMVIDNSSISGQLQVADRGNPFNVVLRNTSVGYIFDGRNGSGSITWDSSLPVPNNNCRAGLILNTNR